MCFHLLSDACGAWWPVPTQSRGVGGTSACGAQGMFITPSEVTPVLTPRGTSAIRPVATAAATRPPKHEDQSASGTSGQPAHITGLSMVESVTMSHQGKGQAHRSLARYIIYYTVFSGVGECTTRSVVKAQLVAVCSLLPSAPWLASNSD